MKTRVLDNTKKRLIGAAIERYPNMLMNIVLEDTDTLGLKYLLDMNVQPDISHISAIIEDGRTQLVLLEMILDHVKVIPEDWFRLAVESGDLEIVNLFLRYEKNLDVSKFIQDTVSIKVKRRLLDYVLKREDLCVEKNNWAD